MPNPTPEEAQDDEARTTGRGLARYAYEYIEAAMLIDEKQGAGAGYERVSPIPAYFLASHGIELTLKAFLRHKGVTVAQLSGRKLGHDLHACFRKAKELGLTAIFTATSADIDALSLLVNMNDKQGLRYIRTGAKQFPSWAIVEPLAVRLHQAVAPVVGIHTFTVSYQGSV